jgi:hypothetical protein
MPPYIARRRPAAIRSASFELRKQGHGCPAGAAPDALASDQVNATRRTTSPSRKGPQCVPAPPCDADLAARIARIRQLVDELECDAGENEWLREAFLSGAWLVAPLNNADEDERSSPNILGDGLGAVLCPFAVGPVPESPESFHPFESLGDCATRAMSGCISACAFLPLYDLVLMDDSPPDATPAFFGARNSARVALTPATERGRSASGIPRRIDD